MKGVTDMTIAGIGINGFGYVNSERYEQLNNIGRQTNEEVEEGQKIQPEEEVVEKRAPKILAQGQLEDFAFDFMKSKEFSMTGEDSNIETMDIGRNIADSKKDEILDQYRFFVDDSRKTPFVSEDGVVRRVNR